MTNGQRLYLLIVLPLAAVAAHLLLCTWGAQSDRSNARNPPKQLPVLVWTTTTLDDTGSSLVWRYRGILAREHVSRGEAAAFGVLVPLALLAASGYVFVGWRHHARRAAGRCTSCGYDLGSSGAARCPECGESRAS